MNFAWDPAKARRNRRKHRVTFEEAATILGDPLALTYLDPDHSTSEERFVTVGMSRAKRVLIVAHTERGDNSDYQRASTTQRERKHYEESKE